MELWENTVPGGGCVQYYVRPFAGNELFLSHISRDRDSVIFYINLGLSIKKLQLSILLIDFLSLAVLLAAVVLLHG
jgi:hypothetical protein